MAPSSPCSGLDEGDRGKTTRQEEPGYRMTTLGSKKTSPDLTSAEDNLCSVSAYVLQRIFDMAARGPQRGTSSPVPPAVTPE